MNAAMPWLPMFLALSTSSPFWDREPTGLLSYRQAVYDEWPRTGIPDHFTDEAEYARFVELLAAGGAVRDASYLWWAIRPATRFPTLELRICDACTRVADVAIASLFRCPLRRLVRRPAARTSGRRSRAASSTRTAGARNATASTPSSRRSTGARRSRAATRAGLLTRSPRMRRRSAARPTERVRAILTKAPARTPADDLPRPPSEGRYALRGTALCRRLARRDDGQRASRARGARRGAAGRDDRGAPAGVRSGSSQ